MTRRLTLFLLIAVALLGARQLHERFDRKAKVHLDPAPSSSHNDLSDIWMSLMSGKPVAMAVEALETRLSKKKALRVLELLPNAEDAWLLSLSHEHPSAQSPDASLRIVAPRGLVTGPGVVVRASGSTPGDIKWHIFRESAPARSLAAVTSESVSLVRFPGPLPTGERLIVVASTSDEGEVLARSLFVVSSKEQRLLYKERLALLASVVSQRQARLFGQMILAMKGGFHGAASDLASQIEGGNLVGYLRRLLFLHEFHGRVDAAEAVRELLQRSQLESSAVPR